MILSDNTETIIDDDDDKNTAADDNLIKVIVILVSAWAKTNDQTCSNKIKKKLLICIPENFSLDLKKK